MKDRDSDAGSSPISLQRRLCALVFTTISLLPLNRNAIRAFLFVPLSFRHLRCLGYLEKLRTNHAVTSLTAQTLQPSQPQSPAQHQ